MNILLNEAINKELSQISEVALHIWNKGWGERNGGNISVNLTNLIEEVETEANNEFSLPRHLPELANNIFYVSATGARMRYIAQSPLENGCIIKINSEGTHYSIISNKNIKPTSELPSHLCIHSFFKKEKSTYRVVLHTHCTELIALSHIEMFNKNINLLNKVLWSMLPEVFVFIPKGLGWVPYELPGSLQLADLTIKTLKSHDYVLWEKHGVLGVGENIIDVFDNIDTLAKAAQIYQFCKSCGYEPLGLTDKEIDGLRIAFNIK